jgi:ketosteroid isomerase-like protein
MMTVGRALADDVRDAFEMLSIGDPEPLVALLAPDVVWVAAEEDWVLSGFADVAAELRARAPGARGVMPEEVEGARHRVVATFRSPWWEPPRRFLRERLGVQAQPRFFQVLTTRDGWVVQIRDYASRDEAMAAVGL